MMLGLTRIRTLLYALLCTACVAACGGADGSAEDRLRSWIDTMHAAAEAKDRRRLVAALSPAYMDARGNARADIGNMLRGYFLRQNTVGLLVRVEEINIIDDTIAEVGLTVGMAGSNNSALGFSADAYRFELELEADGDEWQLLSARWGEVGQALR